MATDPFAPTQEQLAPLIATDARLASIAEAERELMEGRQYLEDNLAKAQAEVTRYRAEVLDPAERALRTALVNLRPLVAAVRTARALFNVTRRKRMKLEALRQQRISRIRDMVARKNMVASQRDLFAQFRGRRRRSIYKPEFTQCASLSTRTASSTPTTSPPPAPSNSA